MDIRVGDRVKVELRGDTIPVIGRVLEEFRNADSLPFDFPGFCPGCGVTLETNGRLRCPNSQCPDKRIKQILHFADSVGIKNLSEAKLLEMMEAGLLNDLSEIYALWKPQEVPSWKVLYGLGIEGLGPVACKTLMGALGSFEKLLNIQPDTGNLIDLGLNQAQARSLAQFLDDPDNLRLLQRLGNY
jgi:DNA ligase (NAD+)